MATRTIRTEIVKPLGCTWDELGTILRVQRRIVPQLLRAGMDARIACGVVGAETTKTHVTPDTKGGSPASIVYQAMRAELTKIQGGKWSKEARPALAVPGSTVSALSQRVMQLYGQRASFRGNWPIPLRRQEIKLALLDESIVLEMVLVAGVRTRVVLSASKGGHWHVLRGLAKGAVDYGAIQLDYNKRRKKWYALISYDKPEAASLTVDPARALIVHRGVRNVLTFLTTTGHYSNVEGRKLFAQLQAIEARTRDHRAIGRAELGDGAKGHGKNRRFQRHEALAGKRANVVRTWCQQMASEVARIARHCGCSLVIIEDYGGIEPDDNAHLRRALLRFPLFRLKQSIADRLQLEGATLREVSAEYVSTTCPRCDCKDERNYNKTTGTFHCQQCEFARPGDFVAVLNMARRAQVDMSEWNERLKRFDQLVQKAKETTG